MEITARGLHCDLKVIIIVHGLLRLNVIHSLRMTCFDGRGA